MMGIANDVHPPLVQNIIFQTILKLFYLLT